MKARMSIQLWAVSCYPL